MGYCAFHISTVNFWSLVLVPTVTCVSFGGNFEGKIVHMCWFELEQIGMSNPEVMGGGLNSLCVYVALLFTQVNPFSLLEQKLGLNITL